MRELRDQLIGVEPLDAAVALKSLGQPAAELLHVQDPSFGGVPLISRIQRTLDAVRQHPPPPPVPSETWPSRPWWMPMPALYVAALLQHVGLGSLSCGGRTRAGALPSHARESAKVARALLRRLGLPFTVREHAVALILHQRKPFALVSSGAPAETYMRLACRLHVGSLYQLALADLATGPQDTAAAQRLRLEVFRARADELAVLSAPPAPPVSMEELAALGFGAPEEAHRAANAMRYFRLRARLAEPEWFMERLRHERQRPCGRLNLLIGPAGSGKSSWAKRNVAATRIVSSDRMRAELTGDPADQSQNYLVFQRCMDQIRGLLKQGETVTFDATNYSEELRDMPVQAARWSGAEVHSYFFDMSLQAALELNRTRKRQVPESVIRRHFRLFTPPALYEADCQWVVDREGTAQLYWPAGS